MSELDAVLRRDRSLWQDAIGAAKGGPRVLIATSMGGFNHGTVVERSLAVALTLRGAEVDIFLCDGQPACQLIKADAEPPERLAESEHRARCPRCIASGREMFDVLGLPIHTLNQLLQDQDRVEAAAIARDVDIANLRDLRLGDWAIGEHALAGALRYFARGSLEAEPLAEPVTRRYVDAAVRTARGFDRLLAQGRYDVVVANHGIYVPQGVIAEVTRARGVRLATWNPAYRRHCFVFSHGDTYHHTMISEDVAAWENLTLSPPQRRGVIDYLRSRRSAKDDWIWFQNASPQSASALSTSLGLDSRPVVAALTSVMWDAQLHYKSNAFANQVDWMTQTIAYFRDRPDLQLVIRVHPAEVTGFVPSRDRMADIVRAHFDPLPENVRLVAPDDKLSTYSLVDMANAVLVYNTKTGIEASSEGVPVIVAGEAWIRGKGFTRDAESPESYRALLDELPYAGRLSPDLHERALLYAYHFFFRRMIDLPFIKDESRASFRVDLGRLRDLGPGKFSGLDCVCDGILTGAPFIHEGSRP